MTDRRDVVDYAVVLTIDDEGNEATVRVYDGAHGTNDMHRHSRSGEKAPAETFHAGTLGEGCGAAITAVRTGYEEMIRTWPQREPGRIAHLSVFVSAFIGKPDAGPGRLVEAWRNRRFVLVVSPLLLAELLSRPKFARWAATGNVTSPTLLATTAVCSSGFARSWPAATRPPDAGANRSANSREPERDWGSRI